MSSITEILRDTWCNGYVIRACAVFVSGRGVDTSHRAKAVVQVFKGDPDITLAPEIFISTSKLNCFDLLDELQNAERIGRDYVASIQ